jgi:histidinol-phosphatase (PHP family)
MIDRYTDCHVHTNYSPDADLDATFENYIKRAKEIGINRIYFTDHLDLDPGHPLFETPIQYDNYIEAFKKAKQKTKFDMRLGIEIGYQKHTIDDTMTIINNYPFEYIILSIHYIHKEDFYTKEYFLNKTKEEAYRTYFETCLEAIETTPKFDTFGHLDYITRYSPYGDYDYATYQDIIDQILTTLIQKGKNLEINTSGLYTEGRTYPKQEVIERYIALGGKNIVLSSDAHRPTELARGFTNLFIE